MLNGCTTNEVPPVKPLVTLFESSRACTRQKSVAVGRSAFGVQDVVPLAPPGPSEIGPDVATVDVKPELFETWNSYVTEPAGPVRAAFRVVKVGRGLLAVEPLAGSDTDGTEIMTCCCTLNDCVDDGWPTTPSTTAFQCQ